MGSVIDRLKAGEVLVADGAMGTMLLSRGLTLGRCPELVNLDHPEIIEDFARQYLDVGADFIGANTFGASPLKLSQYKLEHRTEEINSAAVRLVKKVIRDRGYLYASVGPTGSLLEPYGDTDPEQVFDAYVQQIKILSEEGVDLIFIETMTDLAEAVLAVKAAKSVSPSMPVAATMTFDVTPRGFFTIMGVSVKQAAEGLIESGADILGSNCGNGIEMMIKIAAEFRKHTSHPLLIQSNAGLPKIENGVATYPESPEYTADKCRELLTLGVNIIGGCCGTTPAHIASIRAVVDDHNHRSR